MRDMRPNIVRADAPPSPESPHTESDPLGDLEEAFFAVSDLYDDVARMALTEIETVLSSSDADTTLALLPDGSLKATSGDCGIALHRTRGGFAFQALKLIDGSWVASTRAEGYVDDPESINGIASHYLGL